MVPKSAKTWALTLLAVALYGLPMVVADRRAFELPGFVVSPAIGAPQGKPFFAREMVNPGAAEPISHVASICELPSGRLAAAWYAGSREGAGDVVIFLATRDSGAAGWSQPRAIVTRESAARDLGRRVKKVGNSVLFCDPSGRLRLLFSTITAGGWSGSSLNLIESADEGRSWTQGQHLTLSPLFNMGELVKNQPVLLADGSWAVPIYQELAGPSAELLWLRQSHGAWDATKIRMTAGDSGYQPSLVPLSTNSALGLLRDSTSRSRVSLVRTEDSGRTWSAPEVLSLPNPDSGLAALRLTDGRILLFFNDATRKRENLRLAVSSDEGRKWTRVADLAEPGQTDVSYPFAIQTRDGDIHVVFTWNTEKIQHVHFNPAWLTASQHLALN